MEGLLGRGLSDVRVHTDEHAAASVRGGCIRNIALSAAFYVAETDEPVGMPTY
jgi:hypothetical protein